MTGRARGARTNVRCMAAEKEDVFFSIMRSTWGRVTPELRGVAYLLKGSSLRVRFLYADEPEEWIVEEVSCAETECIADFWPLEVSYVVEHLSVGQPRELQPGQRWVYVRYEPARMMRWWHDDLGGAASFAGDAHVPLRGGRVSRNPVEFRYSV
jgi:hypothetical protein